MRIKSVHTENFKRFSSLSLTDIPETAKLVLLIGANGSGKSCVFDAFQTFAHGWPIKKDGAYHYQPDRNPKPEYNKSSDSEMQLSVIFHDDRFSPFVGAEVQDFIPPAFFSRKFLGRSSNRNIARIPFFTQSPNIKQNEDEPASFIDPDNRFVNDLNFFISKLNQVGVQGFGKNPSDLALLFKEVENNWVVPVNLALARIFNGNPATALQIAGFEPMSVEGPARLYFTKGNSKLNYNFLSHGEKQVVILLLNFLVRRDYYQNSVIFIDEMDCHLNTSLQETLLQEIVENWIPDSAQLWTASHALGFISYAQKSEEAVVFDFDNLDFDHPWRLVPKAKEQMDLFEIAVPREMIHRLFKEKLVLCENKNAEYYNLMGLPSTVFVGAQNARDLFLTVKADNQMKGLRDRDYLTDEEIKNLRVTYPNFYILIFKHFENYLYHPENLKSLNKTNFDHREYQQSMIQQKKDRMKYKLPTMESSRKSYEELRHHPELKSKNLNMLVDASESEDPNQFLKVFDCKEDLDKSFKNHYRISDRDLASTLWFREQMARILEIKK